MTVFGQGCQSWYDEFSILSTLRISILLLDIETHHDRGGTPDRVNGKPPLFQKCCGNCRFHERLTHGPTHMYFRCKSIARMVHLKHSRLKDGPFFNSVMCFKLFEKTECLFWERKNERGISIG